MGYYLAYFYDPGFSIFSFGSFEELRFLEKKDEVAGV
jgi:hypothetical protein